MALRRIGIIDLRLAQWARWRSSSNLCVAPFARERTARGSDGQDAPLVNESAMEMDAFVQRLPEKLRGGVIAHYLTASGSTLAQQARSVRLCGCDRKTTRTEVEVRQMIGRTVEIAHHAVLSHTCSENHAMFAMLHVLERADRLLYAMLLQRREGVEPQPKMRGSRHGKAHQHRMIDQRGRSVVVASVAM